MTIKTILAAASGGSASAGAVETAFLLAQRLDAHVEAFHVRVDERQAIVMYGDGFGGAPLSGDLMKRVADEAAEAASEARKGFDAAVLRHGMKSRPHPSQPAFGDGKGSANWREETGYAPDLIARRARVFDLVVLGRSQRVVDKPHSDTLETAVLDSGHAVLIAPVTAEAEFGRSITIGWNGSIESVHALTASLPLLAQAKQIDIVTIGEEDEGLGIAAVEHLAWHGIAATARMVLPVSGVGPGEQLLSTARENGADLLVMGAYAKAPWREFLFGGATHDVVGTSLMPLLLAH